MSIRRISIVLAVMLALSVLLAACASKLVNKQPEADNGIIDLTEWDFEKDGIASLDGKWEFYWEQLLEPEDFISSLPGLTGYYDVPLYWHKYKDLNLPIFGYATYKLTVITGRKNELLALKIPNIPAAYKLWANGELIAQRGDLESNSYGMQFISPLISKSFISKFDKIDLVLQVTNYIDPESGISHSIEIGHISKIYEKRNFKVINEALMFGICAIMAFYHFILYAFRKKNKEVLFFGLFCLTIGIRLISQGENILGNILPNMSYYIGSAILYGTAPLAALFYTYFKYYLFTKYVSKIIINIFSISNAVYTLVILLTPMVFYGNIFYYYLIFIIINAIYVMLFLVIRALLRKEKEAIIVIIGSLVLFVTIINDILYFNQANNAGYLVSLGLFVFIFCQSLVIARRFSHAFKNVESLSERLITLDKIKDEFLANTSHELRTPVNGIIGISESLIDGATGELPPQTKDNLEMIVSSGKRLASLINDILDFSKLKNRDIILQNKSIDLRQTVNVVLTVIKTTYTNDSVMLKNDIPEGINISGDENRMQQIMYNLIGNAVKFTDEGFVRISAEEKGDMVQVCIEDTGIGIPRERYEDIFKSFEQVDSSISREYGGTGLGLSITKQLVELHGGEIWLESEEGVGTRFYFTLKISSDDNSVEQSSNVLEGAAMQNEKENEQRFIITDVAATEAGKAVDNDIRILVVDDERINVQVLSNQLSVNKYHVDAASDGIEALEKLELFKYDLVLLDIMMPKMSGYDVCKRIREKYSLYDLPVILLTAKNQVQDVVAGFDVGANDYLVKPFEKNELIARVKTLISLKTAVRTAIEHAKLFGEVKKLAELDGLTGLNNRRHLFELAKKEWDHAVSNNKVLSVLMIDIDFFKKVNDNYGHEAGDIVLQHVAAIVVKAVRGFDIAGRYGGEEFAVVLPDTGFEEAMIAAERIRSAIAGQILYTDGKIELKCTASIGVASYSQGTKEIEQLFSKADSMLYKAKASGRNRVEG